MTKIFFNKIKKDFVYSFAKSSGPGGQHVNTTDSKVILSWHFMNSDVLSETQKNDITKKLKTYVNKDSVFSVNSSKSRVRIRNKEDCLSKTFKLLEEAFKKPLVRRKTKPSKSAIRKRLDSKKKHSNQKKSRGKVDY